MFRFVKISFVSISLLLSIGMLSSCSTGLSGETVYGRAESPLWFRSASRETIIAHLASNVVVMDINRVQIDSLTA